MRRRLTVLALVVAAAAVAGTPGGASRQRCDGHTPAGSVVDCFSGAYHGTGFLPMEETISFRRVAAADLRSLMRPATYAPETKRIDDLLREMQKARLQLAVVVDEYGGAVGIVTVEDIVEEVVGEIHDEHDRTPDTVERLPDGSYRVAGRTGIDELNEALDWELPKGDFETVAGLVLATLHRLPLVGEVLHVGRYTLTVLEADRRRILTVRITAGGAAPEEKPAT